MHQYVLLPGILLVLVFKMISCQFPYEAEVDERTGQISIDGSLVKGEALQTVRVSRSTSLYNPEFDPFLGCAVFIEDELGNTFTFSEIANGIYQRAIEDEFLVFNREYKLVVITPEDERYESDYEAITQGAPVDSVYYERDQSYDNSTDEVLEGIRFYLDLKGSETDSRYYRWSLSETWELRSIWPVNYFLNFEDTTKVYLDSPYELYYCWNSKNIPGIYSSSTINLASNLKKKIPLHFVSNKTDRLYIKYSLLVDQYSLNEGAYAYWNQIKMETEENGGLYTQQPGQTQTNLFNVNDDHESVLGYFWASSKTSKRIFIKHPPDLIVYTPHCELELFDDSMLASSQYPIYISLIGFPPTPYTSDKQCLNCTLRGGSNIMPSFWE